MGSVSSTSRRCTFLSFRPGLVGFEHHAEYLFGERSGFWSRLGEFHATAFTAPAGVDLRLDDDAARALVEQALGRGRGVLHGGDHLAARDGDAIFREDLFALVLVDFHGAFD